VQNEHIFFTLDTFKSIQYRYRPERKSTKCSFKAANGNKVFSDGVAFVVLNFKETEWDLFLGYIVIAYNSSVHESTGYSPFRIVYGKEMSLPINVQTRSEFNESRGPTGERHNNIPTFVKNLQEKLIEIHSLMRDNLSKSVERQKKHYDCRMKIHQYEVGDFVMRNQKKTVSRVKSKIVRHWTGQWIIIKNYVLCCSKFDIQNHLYLL
jgi:hypothetical protein